MRKDPPASLKSCTNFMFLFVLFLASSDLVTAAACRIPCLCEKASPGDPEVPQERFSYTFCLRTQQNLSRPITFRFIQELFLSNHSSVLIEDLLCTRPSITVAGSKRQNMGLGNVLKNTNFGNTCHQVSHARDDDPTSRSHPQQKIQTLHHTNLFFCLGTNYSSNFLRSRTSRILEYTL